MSKEHFDIEISFGGKPPVRMNNLTGEQMGQLKAIFDAAPCAKGWTLVGVHLPASFAERARVRWYRALQWLQPLVIVALLLAAPVFAQERLSPRAVEPIRVALTLEESEASGDFDERLRAELNNLRRVAFASRAVDFDIYITTGPIIAGEKTIGCVSAVAVVTAGAKDRPITVLLVLGPTSAETAKRTARRINEEFFEKASR